MKATTIKVSVETRERLRALGGGATYEETLLEAIDALAAERFWAQADAAAAWRASLDRQRTAELDAEEAAMDAALDALE